jgi:hypothetical protein
MSEKPLDKSRRPKAPADAPAGEPGRLAPDDRGNITWEWKNDVDLLADDSLGAAERVRALLDANLDIAEEPDDIDDAGKPGTKRLKTGYNPYNSGPLGKQTWKKKKDLRELSKWIELRKKVSDKAPGDDGTP